MTPLSSWGRLSAQAHELLALNDPHMVRPLVRGRNRPGIAYGMGRSYGDVCLNPGGIAWLTAGLDHFIAFDEDSGRLHCEAGVLLRDIQRLVIPRGWILPVTPGTQMVTVGGAIANDVHGKNHHLRGSFGDHVRRVKLLRTDGETIVCSPQFSADWFTATVGGLGLTGVIVEAEIQLCRAPGPWLEAETIPYAGLDEFLSLSDESETRWEHTVSWFDCLSGDSGRSRGLFMRANPSKDSAHQVPHKPTLNVPMVPPASLVNSLSLRPFNAAYYHLNKHRTGPRIEYYESFLYPLDRILHWNRMYGPKGFYQYQSVVPRAVGKDAIHAMLSEIARSREGSFLAVLKTFADRASPGMLSFPRSGITLALDFPNRGVRTQRLLGRLDAIVREAQGRIYPAKDARMPRDLFESGYPRLTEFLKYRDPGISSQLSRRLIGK